ncbi:MAG: Asp23/Gls24 family envelope stress response protein [Ruminococcaceae bacterium]|nr:Asp23/Gls24 family envelope stress response protein [Oscillospiraceae bacterium]
MDENTVYVESGAVKISEEVVQAIAAMAVAETKGVALPTSLTDGFVEKFVKKNYNKNIRIDMSEKQVSIEIHVMVDYGAKIQAVSAELQDSVKRSIETMTDLTVLRVDICIDGINAAKEAAKDNTPAVTE